MNAEGQTREDWMADQEQRIVDLEDDARNLRTIIERIGREKRTCAVPEKTGFIMYLLVIFIVIDVGLALLAILR